MDNLTIKQFNHLKYRTRYLKTNLLFLLVIPFFFTACTENYTPKPRGYFRITFPEREYKNFESNAPYKFETPVYSVILPDSSSLAEAWWYNINFPKMKGTIHLSYKNLTGNLNEYVEESRSLVYKHTIKADAINEQAFIKPDENIYGVLYEIKGNAASPYQFFVTDSSKHFLRGALYFNVYPNKDSLAPVFKFIKKDIIHLMESVEWKN
ncbi:MAG: gliding motility lipoprotein GldD [Bacteroidetes bacterium 4572_117]|nr:MAG: gliding motility lipoprotein GldD [Bacteroidetes bacterium 4572_117]